VAEQHLLDEVDGGVLERVHVPGPHVAAVVDQDVDAPEALERRGDGRRPVLAASEIELDDEGVDTEGSDLAGGLLQAAGERRGVGLPDGRRMLEAFRARHRARGEDEIEPAPGELQGAAAADAAARPGDEGDSPLAHTAVLTPMASGGQTR